jgi:hypothetical protein
MIEKTLSPEMPDGKNHLQRDGRTCYVLVDVDPNIISHAIELTRRQKLRGYGAVHLACALFL